MAKLKHNPMDNPQMDYAAVALSYMKHPEESLVKIANILADELEAADVTAWTSSGSVDLELEGRREDYTVHMTTSSGSVSGVQPGGDGDRILTVSTSSGSINVSFTE